MEDETGMPDSKGETPKPVTTGARFTGSTVDLTGASAFYQRRWDDARRLLGSQVTRLGPHRDKLGSCFLKLFRPELKRKIANKAKLGLTSADPVAGALMVTVDYYFYLHRIIPEESKKTPRLQFSIVGERAMEILRKTPAGLREWQAAVRDWEHFIGLGKKSEAHR